MKFSDPNLLAAIKMCQGSKLSDYRAVGHNLFWDRRIGAARAASFEKCLSLSVVGSEEEFCEAVRRYHKSHVEWNVEEQPCEFFQSANDCAGSEYLPTERTVLVRMVNIKFALKKSGLTLEQLKNALPLHHGAAANEASDNIACARSFLKKFVKIWNGYKQRPPAFAGFADDVEVELGKPDWPDQLRRRFGLGQMRVPARGTPIPVMLLRYSVADVLNAAKKHGVTATAIRVPTTLESNLYPYFYPSPTSYPYGMTVHLDGDQAVRRLASEIVHLPVDISLAHIDRVGEIGETKPTPALSVLRNHHLDALRIDTGREDFGEYMSHDAT